MNKILFIFFSVFLFPVVTWAQTPFESRPQNSNVFPELHPAGADQAPPAFNGETPLKPVKPFAKKPKNTCRRPINRQNVCHPLTAKPSDFWQILILRLKSSF